MVSRNRIIRACQLGFLGLQLSDRPQLYKIGLKISRKCNFSCYYCYARMYRSRPENNFEQELNSKDAERILEEAWNIGCRFSTFGGLTGEVSMHSEFYHILEVAKRIGYTVNFTTNGWNIDPARLSMLEPIDRIRISIDKMHLEGSPDPLAYIDRLSSMMEGCINLKLSICVVTHGESTRDIDKMLDKIGVNVYNYPLITCPSKPHQCERINTFRCIDPWTSMSIESDLKVNPCSCSSECIGSINDGIKLRDVWFGKKLMAFREMMASSTPPTICCSCDRSYRDIYQWCKAVYNNKSVI